MCNSLLQFGPKGQLEPELASSWKQTSPTTYVYNLVHNARFWDGNPVTPADVAFSVNRIASPKLASPLLSLLQTGNIKKAVVSGRWQVTIELTSPNPIAQDLPATPIGQVVEESVVEKWGSAFGSAPNKVMCSGPFRPLKYLQGTETVLDAVPNYWDSTAQPKIKSITFETVNDAEALIAGLRSGAINGTYDLPARDASTLLSDSSLKIKMVPYGGDTNYLSPNVMKGPFANAEVRRAFNLAVPRSALAIAVDGANGRPLKGIETPALFTQQAAAYMAAYNALPNPDSPNVPAAKKLIAKAHAKGETVSIGVENSLTSDTVSAVLQQIGQSIGLNVKIVKLTPAAFGNVSYSATARVPTTPCSTGGTRTSRHRRRRSCLRSRATTQTSRATSRRPSTRFAEVGGDGQWKRGAGQRDHRHDEAADRRRRLHAAVLGPARSWSSRRTSRATRRRRCLSTRTSRIRCSSPRKSDVEISHARSATDRPRRAR